MVFRDGRRGKLRGEGANPFTRQAIRLAEAVVAAVTTILVLQYVLGFALLDPAFTDEFQDAFYRGVVGTAIFTAIVIPVGLVVGFLLGWAQLARYRVIAWPARFIVEVFRGVPPIVLIFFAFLFAAIVIPRQLNPFQAAIFIGALALAIHSAAYQAEIFRAGFQSVPRGQLEAAQSVGMTGGKALGFVVLPQALRLVLPPLGNEFALAIKDTSLLMVIGAIELFSQGQAFAARIPFIEGAFPAWLFATWIGVAAAYFLITLGVTRILRGVEFFVKTSVAVEAGA